MSAATLIAFLAISSADILPSIKIFPAANNESLSDINKVFTREKTFKNLVRKILRKF